MTKTHIMHHIRITVEGSEYVAVKIPELDRAIITGGSQHFEIVQKIEIIPIISNAPTLERVKGE